MVWLIRLFISISITAMLNLALLWWHETINSSIHRHISRYPECIVLCKEIISYFTSVFTHIMRNWVCGFVMSAFLHKFDSPLLLQVWESTVKQCLSKALSILQHHVYRTKKFLHTAFMSREYRTKNKQFFPRNTKTLFP